jgi:hypothetical protein
MLREDKPNQDAKQESWHGSGSDQQKWYPRQIFPMKAESALPSQRLKDSEKLVTLLGK